jgi:predicted phosphoribosyltransferase
MLYRNRAEAGRILARKLSKYTDRPDVLVLAIPRGGVPVAFEVAGALRAPLDVFLVRKLGVPGREELAFGAVAMGGVRILNNIVVQNLGVSDEVIEDVTAEERLALESGARTYRGNRPAPCVHDRTVILIDDGLATGSTMRAAVAALRRLRPARIVVAVPVAAPDVCANFQTVADEIVCAWTPEPFHAVGLWYEDFSQTTTAEVRDLLERADERERNPSPLSPSPSLPIPRAAPRFRLTPDRRASLLGGADP